MSKKAETYIDWMVRCCRAHFPRVVFEPEIKSKRTLKAAKEFVSKRGLPQDEEQLTVWLFAYAGGVE